VRFLGIPSFAPEILRRVRLEDAIKARKLKEALAQMAEEGVVQLFSPVDGTPPIVGVIGALQLDVLADRLKEEYGLPVAFDTAPCDTARWISSEKAAALTQFIASHRPEIATDLDGDHVYLAPSAFALSWTQEKNPDIVFTDIKTIDRV
jgi:peptide chain release factor 3